MSSSYQTNKPEPTDFLSQSAADIQGNFSVANTIMAIDHYPFDNLSTSKGFHKQIRLPELGAAPATGTNIGAVYTKEAQAITNLFFKQEGGTEIQLTNVAPSNAANGYTFLPGGLLIQWNQSTINLGGNTTINFPITFSAACYSVVVTPIRNASNVDIVYVVSQAAGSFVVRNTSGSAITQCNWIAIGPKS